MSIFVKTNNPIMARKLSQMTWDDVQSEMSIAGSPQKITGLGRKVFDLIAGEIDQTNKAELINVEFMLDRVKAEIRLMQKRIK